MTGRLSLPVRMSGALAAAAVLAGCGGSGTSTAPAGPTSGPVSGVSSSPAAGSPSPGSPYLAVPDGVGLTTPGTSRAFGGAATVAWSPRQDVVGVVDLTVTGVESADPASAFRGYQVDARTLASTPLFVHATVTNAGTSDLGGRVLPLYVADTQEQVVGPTGIAQTFAPCPGGALPSSFGPGATARVCLVFLVPQAASLDEVRFQPPVGVAPLAWTGAVRPVAAPRARHGRRS